MPTAHDPTQGGALFLFKKLFLKRAPDTLAVDHHFRDAKDLLQ